MSVSFFQGRLRSRNWLEHQHSQWRQPQGDALQVAVRANGFAVDASHISEVSAAEDIGVAVEDFGVKPGPGNAKAVVP